MLASRGNERLPASGVLFCLLALFLFSALDATAKYLSTFLAVPLLVWARYLVQLLLMLLSVAPRLGRSILLTRRPGLMALRGVTLAGVTIGKVTAVDLDRDSYTGRVTMEINQNVNNLPVDSTASILTAGLLGEKYIGISVGGDEDVLKDGSTIHDTQSALVLEDLIGKFLLNSVNKDEAKK